MVIRVGETNKQGTQLLAGRGKDGAGRGRIAWTKRSVGLTEPRTSGCDHIDKTIAWLEGATDKWLWHSSRIVSIDTESTAYAPWSEENGEIREYHRDVVPHSGAARVCDEGGPSEPFFRSCGDGSTVMA